MTNPKTLDLDFEFWFGKHEGMTVAWVLDNDPSYLVWLHRNTEWIIDPIVLDEAHKAVARSEW